MIKSISWITILSTYLLSDFGVCFVSIHHGYVRSSSDGRSSFLHSSNLPEVSTMRASELKKELIDYGIDTKSFLEKNELIEAVEKARAQGKSPSKQTSGVGEEENTSTTKVDDSTNGNLRDMKIIQEMTNIQNTMKTSQMKKELEDIGISTRTFLEKNEYVKALAEARINGVPKNSKSSVSPNQKQSTANEGYAEYKNVEVLTNDADGPKKRNQQEQQQQSSRSTNPFGGSPGSNMNGFADILKNMGMGSVGGPSAGAANPFGRNAGNPFGGVGGGDVAVKAQQLMQNPKVREIFMKAQKNPRIMAAVTECMSNPAAFSKYRSDPEVSELVRELQQYM